MSEQYGGPWNTPADAEPGQPAAPRLDQTPPPPYGASQPPPYGASQPYGVEPQPYPQPGQTLNPPPTGYPVASYPGYPSGPAPLRNDYARWRSRVAASLIDTLPTLIGLIILYVGYGIALVQAIRSGTGTIDLRSAAAAMITGGIIAVAGMLWSVYNRWFVAGRTGQSLGKRVTKTVLIGDDTNAPIGPLNAFLRDLVHTLDGMAYVGYLWPLWDERRQTFADKIMRTVVITAPGQPR